jgi:hypothetical protein
MWPFSRKHNLDLRPDQKPTAITDLIDDRDLKDLSKNSAVLRVWLPGAGRTALNQIAKNAGPVAAKYLREFFAVYLYGIHELAKMQARKEGLYYEAPPESLAKDSQKEESTGGIRYSRSPSVECIPGLGKNIYPLKIYVPQKMKDDLQQLADKVNIPLSQFIREILVSHFFGQTFWPGRLKTWSDEQELIGIEWEKGERECEVVSYNGTRPTEIEGDQVVKEFGYF